MGLLKENKAVAWAGLSLPLDRLSDLQHDITLAPILVHGEGSESHSSHDLLKDFWALTLEEYLGDLSV